ncbi:TlpA family protein disulfide reductase [Halovenus sp. HT40]|uniref:TlpA family protein disulfide reductase n=1 Tax=Halovenus sp. HT40 TaxID=3126691 RepID=UPI00300ED6D7
MNRRELLAGLAGTAVVGGGAVYAYSSQTAETIEPVTVEQIDESGTVTGELSVPQRGSPTVLTVFATWCSTCRRTMPEVVRAYEQTDGAQFVSVSNEAVGQTVTREDVGEWWAKHGGDWPVSLDTDLELTETFDVRGVPHTVVLNAANRIVYDEQGRKTAADIIDALEET